MQGRVDVKAFSSDGSYYKLSVQLNMTSDRTKVCLGFMTIHVLNFCFFHLELGVVSVSYSLYIFIVIDLMYLTLLLDNIHDLSFVSLEICAVCLTVLKVSVHVGCVSSRCSLVILILVTVDTGW